MSQLLESLGISDPTLILLGGVVVIVVIFFFTGVQYYVKSRVNIVEQRMHRTLAASSEAAEGRLGAGSYADKQESSFLGNAFRSVGKIARPLDEESMGRLRAQLAHAGFRGDRAVLNYLSLKIFLSLTALGLFLWYLYNREQPLKNYPVYIVGSLLVGFYIPNLVVRHRVEKRQLAIGRALPDALDLLVTCVESGLGIDAATNRVGNEIAMSAPLLSQELLQLGFEIKAGATRGEAFRRMAERTGVEEIRNLSALVVQAERFGTSMAKTLRVMSGGMRTRRMQKAEERAATASVKMTIPLVFCIFPTLLIIILGPAILKMMKIFGTLGK